MAYFTEKFAGISAAFEDGFLNGIVSVLAAFNPVLILADTIDGLVQYLFGIDLYAVGADFIGGLWDGVRAKWDKFRAWLDQAVQKLTGMLPGWVKEQLGFEDAGDTWTAPPPRPDPAGSEPAAFGAERYGIVPPSERPGAPGDTRPLTDRVMGATRGTLAPATGAALILGAPVAPLETGPDAPTPQIQTETVEIHGPQTPGSAGVPGRDGRPAGAAGGPSVTTTVHLTVNGAVEPDALRRTVETAVEDAVRRALEDARDAQAADERASLYD